MIYVLILRIKVSFINVCQTLCIIALLAAGTEYKQVTLWPTADLEKIKTELRNDGFLHITVPIKI